MAGLVPAIAPPNRAPRHNRPKLSVSNTEHSLAMTEAGAGPIRNPTVAIANTCALAPAGPGCRAGGRIAAGGVDVGGAARRHDLAGPRPSRRVPDPRP